MRKPFVALLFSLALAPAIAAEATAPEQSPYLAADAIDFAHYLPPPPQPGRDDQQRDIATVLLARANATEAERARAAADAEISIYRFADVLGPKFRERSLPKTTAFFARVLKSWGSLSSAGKVFWHHDRPFVMDTNVQATTDIVQGVCNSKSGPGSTYASCPTNVSYSYPSGHSAFGTVTGLILGEMVPEKRAELITRGWQYGWSRVIAGAHFLTDVEGGRVLGTVVVVLMMQNPQFRADLAEARAELRKQLGLPPA